MHGKGRGFHKKRTDRVGGNPDVQTVRGVFNCSCGATLHTGEKIYRVGNRFVCGVCAIMQKNEGRKR